jgi:hypothetical protein
VDQLNLVVPHPVSIFMQWMRASDDSRIRTSTTALLLFKLLVSVILPKRLVFDLSRFLHVLIPERVEN